MFTHTENTLENRHFQTTPQENRILAADSAIEKSPKQVTYVLVSIMSKLFQDENTLYPIMKSTHYSHQSHKQLPIIYICADTLQEITKPYLYPSNSESTRDPIDRERERWKKKHDKFYGKEENIELKKEIVMWETLKSIPIYSQIRHFTDSILCLKNSELSDYFPDLDENSLSEFTKDIEDVSQPLLENIHIISESFSSKNTEKMKKKAKAEQKEKEKLQKKLGSIFRTDVLANETNLDTELSTIAQGLRNVTPNYLSEEFAVFILINYLNSSALIKDNLGLESFHEDTSEILPELIYPIRSSGQQAKLTFSAFSMIETLYIKYCERLCLPKISIPLTLTDVNINTHLNDESLKLVDDSIGKREHDDDQEMELSSTPSNSSNEGKPIKKEMTVSSAWPTMYYPSSEQPNNEAEKITKKIVAMISDHQITGEEFAELRYKNGITCTIKVNGRRQITDEPPIENNTRLQALTRIIYSAVISTWEDGLEEKRNFVYAGYSFTLETEKSNFENTQVKNSNFFSHR